MCRFSLHTHLLLYNTTVMFLCAAIIFVIVSSTCCYLCFPWRKDLFDSLFLFCPPYLLLFVLLRAKVFWEGYSLFCFVFFRDFAPAWVRNCFCCGAAKLFETLYMISVCTNKLIMTCLQLHHSYKARMCLNQSGSFVHCQSAQDITFPWFAVICSSLCLLKRSPGIYHEVLIAM